jgi:histidinol-phosphate aminotransferase
MGLQRQKMIQPKTYLKDIYRTPHDIYDRTGFLRLDKNEGAYVIPDKILKKIINQITPDFLTTYPQMVFLYKCLTEYLSIEEDHIFVTAGSDAAIKTTFETFVQPCDEVITPDPTYAMYEVYSHLFQAKLRKVVYDKNLKISIDQIVNQITDKSKLIALPNPDSPTGSIIPLSDIRKLIQIANDRGIVVIIDEAYYPFTDITAIGLVDEFSNLIITRTFSKAFGLASIRLGFIVAHPDMIGWLRKFKPMYEVAGFAVLFGCEMLKNFHYVEKIVDKTNEGKKFFESEMERIGLKTYPSFANFVHVEIGEKNVPNLVEEMRSCGVLIKGGANHITLKKCVRIGVAPKKEMRKIVKIIEKFRERNPKILVQKL